MSMIRKNGPSARNGGNSRDANIYFVLVGGTGICKPYPAIALARSCIRSGARGRFYSAVGLVNCIDIGTRNRRQDRPAEYLIKMDLVILDELQTFALCSVGRPASVPSAQQAIRAHLSHRHHRSCSLRTTQRVRRHKGDRCIARTG